MLSLNFILKFGDPINIFNYLDRQVQLNDVTYYDVLNINSQYYYLFINNFIADFKNFRQNFKQMFQLMMLEYVCLYLYYYYL